MNQHQLDELLENGVIDHATAERIAAYYRARQDGTKSNRLLTIFGILGALLVGLGIMLILAHNWDQLPRAAKTILAFVPLLIGQGLVAFTLLRRPERVGWREASGTFLTLAVGASISLVSQIYNIPGEIESFMLTWVVLSLPLVWLLRSSMVALLCWLGLTIYALMTGFDHDGWMLLWYWVLILPLFWHYRTLLRETPAGNFTFLHHWMIPVSIALVLNTGVWGRGEVLLILVYSGLFGAYYLIGNHPYFRRCPVWSNGYKIIGWIGTLVGLLVFSFRMPWEAIADKSDELFLHLFTTPAGWLALLVNGLAGWLLWRLHQRQLVRPQMQPVAYVFGVLFLLFLVGNLSPVLGMIICNLLVLGLGLLRIRRGIEEEHLLGLNLGLGIIAILIICRFFDENLPFVVRGGLFFVVGIGFFVANYQMLKKRQRHAE